jgi:polysaccharide biosynthesis protein PslH
MKITLLCIEIPYPATNGSRIDMWRRIKAFATQGTELQAIVWWFGTKPTLDEIAEIQKYVKRLHLFQIEQTWTARLRRLPDLLSYPLETTSRIIKGVKLNTLIDEVRNFNPDAIFLESIHGGVIATSLSQSLNIPLLTRSPNIEHLYAQKMLQSTIRLKDKLRRYLATIHLEKYEKSILKNSAFFYDISADDLKFWQAAGFTNGRLLPPMIEFPDSETASSHNSISTTIPTKQIEEIATSYDLVFLGNLYAENNVAGLIWFLTEVWPIVRAQLPETTVLIAGSNPVPRIRQICEKTQGVTLRINPKSASDTYRSGRVLINPILKGSGVKIKSIDMLTIGLPIVSTIEGVSGLPEAIKKYFIIASDTASFAAASIKFLSAIQRSSAALTEQKDNSDLPIIADRELLESFFGNKIIQTVISDIESIIQQQ